MSKGSYHPTPCQGKIYDNIPVYSLAGELMFLTNRKRANWYLDRKLAEEKDNPHSVGIHLTFEPNGKGHVNDPYYLQTMANRCCVCGSEDGLFRQHIVPLALRRYFPDTIKSHSHFDILPLCGTCRRSWERNMQDVFNGLLDSHFIPRNGMEFDAFGYERKKNPFIRAKISASALLQHVDKIPEARRLELEQHVREAYPELDQTSTKTWIYARALPDPAVVKPGFSLVERYDRDSPKAILRFLITPFRAEFLRSMLPKFLPAGWTIERSRP